MSEEINWSPGFTAYPAFQGGVSPYAAKVQIVGGNDIGGGKKLSSCVIDWNDGTTPETVQLVDGIANVTHAYTYAKGESKYNGHTFYPTVTFTLSDGTTRVFNTRKTGRCIIIEVQSQV